MMDTLHQMVAWLGNHPAWLSGAIFATAFVESLAIAGVVVPGVAILFAVATLAGQVHMPLIEALAWAAAGAVAGDGVSFWLGRQFQGRLHRLWPFSRHPTMIDRGARFFHQHGGKSVVLGRFVGPLRPILPLIAGAFHMPAQRFIAFNVVSALGWAPVYVIPGYLVGSAMALDLKLPPHFYPVLGLSLGLLALIYLFIFRLQMGLGSDGYLYRRLQTLARSHPLAERIWQTLSSDRPQGPEFPLASIMLTLGSLALFTLWSLLCLETHMLSPLDQATAAFFAPLRNPLFDPVAVSLTLLGDPALLTLLGLIAVTFFLLRDMPAAALHLLAAGVMVTVVTTLLKAGLAVPRPDEVSVPPASFAYPSGHASGVAAMIGLAASFVAHEWPRRRRWMIYGAFGVPMLVIALSRLYLGVHWFTDVVGGLLLGLSICGLIRVSYSRYDRHRLRHDALSLGALAAMAITAACYVWLALPAGLWRYAPVS
ncbi:phosphatase PAP2 family protein [Marinobacter halodurans]|uniref:Phosphatase PAP2 family protein n=1 Tax=Marinobacter halodurans TaxID=2528979 RepID=A0ABY1ZMQ3_9GAMM|nr:bifunctional DedA family/phosphatase PAP2 family protein [Marinobacter halodurans]TBW56220.1 phosphatase PAP2 family protein [Marinobacter halodurans]